MKPLSISYKEEARQVHDGPLRMNLLIALAKEMRKGPYADGDLYSQMKTLAAKADRIIQLRLICPECGGDGIALEEHAIGTDGMHRNRFCTKCFLDEEQCRDEDGLPTDCKKRKSSQCETCDGTGDIYDNPTKGEGDEH